MHALRTAINRRHVKRRPPRRRIDPIDDPARDRVLVVLSMMRPIRVSASSGQAMLERANVVRRRCEVHEPREQRTLRRGRLCSGPRPRGASCVWWVALLRVVGDDDGRGWAWSWGRRVAHGRGQPNDLRERVADRFEVRVNSGRVRRAWRARQLAAEWCADEAAHLLGRELGFGEEVAELRQRALPTFLRF